MDSNFRMAVDNPTGDEDWVTRRWVCHPASTGAKQLTVIDATIAQGQGHSFHSHPNQEEVVFVIAGKVEQWVNRENAFWALAMPRLYRPAWFTHRSMRAKAMPGW